jgi:hypothetical protein
VLFLGLGPELVSDGLAGVEVLDFGLEELLELEFIVSLSLLFVSDGGFQVDFGGKLGDSLLGLLDLVLEFFQAGVALALKSVNELVVIVLLLLEVGFDALQHFNQVLNWAFGGKLQLNRVQNSLTKFALFHVLQYLEVAFIVLFGGEAAD